MQSAVPAVPIKLINQALLMAGAMSARCGAQGKGCWGAAEGAWLGADLPVGHPQGHWMQSESPARAARGQEVCGMKQGTHQISHQCSVWQVPL